jgi:endoglucanase
MRSTKLAGALIAALVCSEAVAQTASPPDGKTGEWCDLQQGVPHSRLEKMRRGFNLTGWLDGPARRRPDFSVLADLRARGFTHIRLPLKPELIASEYSRADDVSRTFDELAFAVETLLALRFSVSVDLHPGADVARLHREQPDKALLLLDRLWTEVASRLSRYPADRVFFEVLNEPDVPSQVWQVHGPALARTIRRIAPQHTIIYAPPNYQTISALNDLAPLADENVVYAVHFYQPMAFTHQGLTWNPRDARRHIAYLPFPASFADPAVVTLSKRLATSHPDALRLLEADLQSPWTEQRIFDEISKATDWMKRHRRPVILNEFGVLTLKTAPKDRSRWLSAVTRSAEHFCIGWTHWEYADAFGFVRRTDKGETIDESVVHALLRK